MVTNFLKYNLSFLILGNFLKSVIFDNKAETPLFRKFPEIRKFKLYFRKYVTMLSVVSRPDNAHNFKFQEIFSGPSDIIGYRTISEGSLWT